MREIKFRAWDKKNEEMRFGYPVIEKGVYKRFVEDITGSYFGVGINNGNYGMELMQFTGLKDKNGKEIYERDIIKHIRKHWYCPGHPKHNKDLVDNCEIYFDEENGIISERTIDLTRKNQPPYSSSGILTKNSFNDERADKNIIEVIGNIYENPEFLNQ